MLKRICEWICVLVFAYFACCAFLRVPFSLPGHGNFGVMVVLLGCCLGLVTRPRWLCLVALPAIYVCVSVLTEGFKSHDDFQRRWAAAHNERPWRFDVHSGDSSLIAPTFLTDFATFSSEQHFRHDHTIPGPAGIYFRGGINPMKTLAVCGRVSQAEFIYIHCDSKSEVVAFGAEFAKRFDGKYALHLHDLLIEPASPDFNPSVKPALRWPGTQPLNQPAQPATPVEP